MKTLIIKILSSAGVALLCIFSQVVIFGQVLLDKDRATRGSKPYTETVRRFLAKEEQKIVGGKPAPDAAFPWQVSLGVSWIANPYDAHFCGGSVYSEKWIITASHCMENTDPSQVIVTAGTNRLVPGVTRRNVRQIIMNKNYNNVTFDNDIALLELVDPLPLSFLIKPVSLLTRDLESGISDSSRFVVVGWGAAKEGGGVVRDLRYLDNIPHIDRNTCKLPQSYGDRITDNMICVGFMMGEGDSCQGDSGGPLTVDTATAPKLAGIVSWGDGCARPDKPGVYTRVANYIDWIKDCVAGSTSCHN